MHRQTRLRTFGDALVTVLEARQPFFNMDVVRKLDRLNRLGPNHQEVIDAGTNRRVRRGEDRRMRLRLRRKSGGLHGLRSVVEQTATAYQTAGDHPDERGDALTMTNSKCEHEGYFFGLYFFGPTLRR